MNDPENLNDKLGFQPWQPIIDAVVDDISPDSPAERSGLLGGDRIISADGQKMSDWGDWVEYVRARPEKLIEILVERNDLRLGLEITPDAVDIAGKRSGRIGASVKIPEALFEGMRREYQLGFFAALSAAISKTNGYSLLTLKMMGRILVGDASIKNLSGPISIAKYAGASAKIGFAQFMKFLAIVSISLGVLNLLPIPVLDGGHLFFYLIEAVKGSPVSEAIQAAGQRVGMAILLFLMVIVVFQDIERILG
jgi:regulator of sigma E protease